MASNGTYTVNVSVVDNATKQLAKINSSISNLQKPYNRLAKQIQNFEKLSGLKTLREQTSKLIQPLGV
ncbi:hypothetical protein GCM10007872_26780 [Gluconobacter sphaericus NBRC 12467]|uniref:Uncharacterized protein n=1 Tax=Gluconobacter sphaericus NBRC 12467 TaxID=1307951 RepID=A0AA37SJF2_9PROT|nr:hypothetical protein [Gluconobacter sphaericus]MBF0886748.1 hypothetical protein [Gluconobacter sphaericus]GEB43544.1 hypothetical protein GSP01_23260 [Gluconobacter sphaericus NBRC 12467]GLQ85768.1 hypothetical protein GCM10007872_26780 [Gluconobacter sphaericus NBRC 12467]